MSSSPPLVVADRYRLVAPLGQGGMGRVWRATDVVLHRDVAIKELVPPPGLTPGERQEMRERSLREARAIARLNNINVVRVFDVLRTDADPWIVMEYVASRSLQDALAADGPFNAVRAAEIGLGVLNALRAAHRAGVMHRDVKPGNVLLGADGRVVLTDFGLATVPGDPNVTRTGLVLGSPAYIAPERARDGTAGPAADLWSLGATLFAAVEGQSPFARPSAIATLAALATENVPPSRNAGPLKAVLNGLLRKDPAHRIDAEEAERLLARAAGRRGRVTLPMSPTMRRPGVGRERPSLPSGPGGPPVLPGSGFAPGSATGSAPVVPGPRPPVKAGPQPGVRPTFAQGKAPVNPAETPPRAPRPPGKPLDATRLDTPPVPKETKPLSGTPYAPPTAPRGPQGTPGRATAAVPQSQGKPSSAPVSPARVGFTAADVAANRRKKAAPEHERSLAAATGAFPIVQPTDAAAPVAPPTKPVVPTTPADQATTVMPPTKPVVPTTPSDQATTVMPAGTADKTTVMPPKPADKTTVLPPAPADKTTVLPPAPADKTTAAPADKTTAAPADKTTAAPADKTTVVPAGQATTVVPAETVTAKPAEPEAGSPAVAASTEPEAGTPDADTPNTPVAQTDTPAEDTASKPSAADAADADSPAENTGGAEPKPAAEPEQPPSVPAGATQAETDSAAAAEPTPEPAETRPAETRPAETRPAEPDPAPAATKRDPAPEAPAEPAKPVEPGQAADSGKAPDSIRAADPGKAAEPDRAAEPERPAGDADKTSFVDLTAIVPPAPAPADSATRVVGDLRPAPADAATRVVGDLRTDPGFARSNRPAWTPMAARPNARRTGGITVLGTTLTRRQAAVALGIVLTFLLLVGIILVQAFSTDEGDGTTSAGPSQAAVTGKPAPVKGGATGGATKPSSAAPRSSSPPAVGVPDGWRTYKASGFSFPVPAGVKGGGGGSGLSLSWNNRMVRVDVINAPLGDPVEFIEDQQTDHYRSYQRIGVTPVDYHGKAADWEFTYKTGSGNGQHVVRRAFAIDRTTYILSWYTSPEDWDESQKEWQAIAAGFAKR